MDSKYHFENIIGRSDAIKEVFALMEQAIDSDSDVLITGETGTGKELVAKEIHYNSSRKDKPLLAYNCGATPRKLIASVLFGHRKGAFTEATENKIGLFEAASGGTVILDEIGDTPLDVQPNLLRVLEERKVQRLGETTYKNVDMRVIAITNRELSKDVEANRFRKELYYRLKEFHIHLPPLRERLEDIPLLAEHFYQEARRQNPRDLDGFDSPSATQPKGFAPNVLEMLQRYHWPGNVRELRNAIFRAYALVEENSRIQTCHFRL
jgi:transcriptional regulator with GAF, ATPase, and Fis domain